MPGHNDLGNNDAVNSTQLVGWNPYGLIWFCFYETFTWHDEYNAVLFENLSFIIEAIITFTCKFSCKKEARYIHQELLETKPERKPEWILDICNVSQTLFQMKGWCFSGGQQPKGIHLLMLCFTAFYGSHQPAICLKTARLMRFS